MKPLLDRLWKSDANEVAVRVQIIFPGFIDHAEQGVPLHKVILEDPVELSQLERCRVVVIAHADRKPGGKAGGGPLPSC